MSKIKGLIIFGILAVICALAFSGCVTLGSGEVVSLCDSVPQGQTSVLCALSEAKGISLRDASQLVKLANIAMLESQQYSAADAKKFIKGITGDLERVRKDGISLTYLDVINYVNAKKQLVSPRVLAAFEIVNPGLVSSEILKMTLREYDIDLLIKHLEEELVLVNLYS